MTTICGEKIHIYSGPIDQFQFNDYFAKMFHDIQNTLPDSQKLTYVDVHQITQSYRRHSRGAGKVGPKPLTFKARSEDGQVVWHKYETATAGSGNNTITYRDKKILTSDWLCISSARNAIISGNTTN